VAQIFTAKVQGGVIVADRVELPEGTVVTVVVDDEDAYELAPEEEAVIRIGIAAADRGDVVPLDVVLAELDA